MIFHKCKSFFNQFVELLVEKLQFGEDGVLFAAELYNLSILRI